MVDEADVPVGVSAVLDRAVGRVSHEDYVVEVPAVALHEFAVAARAAVAALVERIAALEKELDIERERLANEALLGEEEHMNVIERHRVRLDRAMKNQIEIVKALQEITAPEEIEGGSGSSVPLVVELGGPRSRPGRRPVTCARLGGPMSHHTIPFDRNTMISGWVTPSGVTNVQASDARAPGPPTAVSEKDPRHVAFVAALARHESEQHCNGC